VAQGVLAKVMGGNPRRAQTRRGQGPQQGERWKSGLSNREAGDRVELQQGEAWQTLDTEAGGPQQGLHPGEKGSVTRPKGQGSEQGQIKSTFPWMISQGKEKIANPWHKF
jgi:hypothetical protein